MRNFEVTFIVDPVLSGDEIKVAAKTYEDFLTSKKCSLIHKQEMGLLQLAYPINKRTSGIYYCFEFEAENGAFIPEMELAMKRDERIMRYLTIRLDKYGVKYNQDKRDGKIGKSKVTLEKDKVKKAQKEKEATVAKKAPVKKAPVEKKTEAKTPVAPPVSAKSEEE